MFLFKILFTLFDLVLIDENLSFSIKNNNLVALFSFYFSSID